MSSLFPQPGPQLPPFKNLLVHGSYHPTAPMHLCLSYTVNPLAKSIIFSPSRQTLLVALQNYNDTALAQRAYHGSVMDAASRVKTFYPPSPTHLMLLLSLLHVSGPTETSSLNSNIMLDCTPVLLVLHEPSAYFLPMQDVSDTNSPYTLSSYLTLISQTISLVSFLSSSQNLGSDAHIAFAVFDSKLDQLKLPVAKSLQPIYTLQDKDSEQDLEHSTSRLEPMLPLVQKYFEWMLIFAHCDCRSSMTGEGAVKPVMQRLRLYRLLAGKIPQSDLGKDVVESEWDWWETKMPTTGRLNQTTSFAWKTVQPE